jgi:hypothetical protein
MAKDIEKTENENETLPAKNPQHNPYEAYGAQAAQRNFVGQILKFAKGNYRFGQNNAELEAGTKVIVDMRTLTVGWQKWQDDRPIDSHMGLVNENFQPPLRKTIGPTEDDGTWEIDKVTKQPRDPWQFSNMVVMREVGTTGEDEGLYSFVTSSRGGINAIGVLSKAYGKKIREDSEALPIIELNADEYQHSTKAYGMIDIPVFKIVDWGTAADVALEGVGEADEVDEEVDEETGEITEAKTRTAPRTAPKADAATRKAAPAKKAEVARGGKKKVRF